MNTLKAICYFLQHTQSLFTPGPKITRVEISHKQSFTKIAIIFVVKGNEFASIRQALDAGLPKMNPSQKSSAPHSDSLSSHSLEDSPHEAPR